MKKNLLIYAALCALVATACSKQDEAESGDYATPQGKAVDVTINATRHETPSTRTVYEEGENKLIVTWTSSDKLGVFTQNNGITSNAEFTTSHDAMSDNRKETIFKGKLTISDPDQRTTVYGYYPHSSTAGSIPTAIPIDLGGQTQIGTTDQSLAHLAAKDYMAATPVTKTFEDGNLFLSFEFNPLLTIMSFEIKQAMEVKSIKLEAVEGTNLTPFYTKGAVDITTVNKAFPITGGGTAQSSVELSVKEGTGTIAAKATGMFNMMIFPIEKSKMPTALKATVTTTDGYVYTKIKNVPTNVSTNGFVRGKRYIMVLDALDAAYGGGNGTKAAPYLLASAEDFAQFAANGSIKDYSKGKYFKLTADIDLKEKPWTPITTFLGNFDGGGHTISNLNVDRTLKSGGSAGLFAKIQDAKIANLHIDGTVKTGVDKKTFDYAGGICGYSQGVCTISGCSFNGSVAGYVSGGICGSGDSKSALTITACCNMGSVTGELSGGILGQSEASAKADITACYNAGAISSKINDPSNLGGIVSSNGIYGSTGLVTVTACYNTRRDEKLPNIVYGKPDRIKVIECYTVFANYDGKNNQNAILFSAGAWPSATGAWTASPAANGSENQYWKSLGGLNNGTTEYPKLWWEK